MRSFNDLDAYFGGGDGGGGRAPVYRNQRYGRPKAAQPMRQPKAVPGPTSFDGINERAMQEAEAEPGPSDEYFNVLDTDNARASRAPAWEGQRVNPAIIRGDEDQSMADDLNAANSDYFAPRSQVSADDQIMGGSIDPTTARMAEDPYFGKPYNEDKDPPGHQKVAATPEGTRGAIGEYADSIRARRATRDQKMDEIKRTKRGFFKSHADFQAEQSQRIANVEAEFQGGVNADNAVLASRAPGAFGKRTPEKHDWRHNENGDLYDAAAATPAVIRGALSAKTNPRAELDERRVANSEEETRLRAKRDADNAAYHDKWIGLMRDTTNARSTDDKKKAEDRAAREIDRDIIKLEAEKLKAVAEAQFAEDKGASIAKGYDDLIAKAQAMRNQDAPTTSVAPPTGGGSGSPGPLGKVEKPAAASGAGPAGMPQKWVDYIMSLPEGKSYEIPGKGSFANKGGRVVKVN